MVPPTRNPRPQANALAAQAWAEVSELLDLQLSPLGLRAMNALSPKPAEVIVDIGCGAGQTVLQLAQRVGPGGQVIGVDIAPLLVTLQHVGSQNVDHRLGQSGTLEGLGTAAEAAHLHVLDRKCRTHIARHFGSEPTPVCQPFRLAP